MSIVLKNNAESTLATAVNATDTGLVVAAGDGAKFATLTGSDYFYLTLTSTGGTTEIVKVTARVGDTMTIVRAQQGTTGQSFAAGSRVEQRITAGEITEATSTNVSIVSGTIDGTVIGGATPAAGSFTDLTVSGTVFFSGATVAISPTFTGTASAPTFNATSIEVTNLKAKDGTAAGSIADSTGVVTLASSVLTTTDINGGSIDGASLGASTAITSLAVEGNIELNGNLDANENVALGSGALISGVTVLSGSDNTAVGHNALIDNTSGSNNTALGHGALDSNVTGGQNTAVGKASLSANTAGSDNTAVGFQALLVNSASDNTAVGYRAMRSNTTGTDNTAIGHEALTDNLTGSRNVAVGEYALSTSTAGSDNTAVGRAALSSADGNKNTGVGREALSGADGDNNTAIGYQAGNAIITGTNNTILGASADPSGFAAVGQIVIGASVTGTADNRITVGISTNIAELDLDGSDTSWAASSDERLKKNIADYTAGVAFISELRPVTYQWRAKRDVPAELNLYEDSDDPVHGKPDVTYHGFVAQEVKQALDNHPEVADGQHFWKQRDDGVQTLAPADLIPILVNAVKEQQEQIDALKTEIELLKGA